jgi:hypothetical protein
MTTIARRVRSTPVRTATETWAVIVDLLSSNDTVMRGDLHAVGDVAAMLICEEYPCDHPILLSGCGPQIRIYTLHGSAAIEGDLANESPLTITTGAAWRLSLPAHGADLRLAAPYLPDTGHVITYDPDANEFKAIAQTATVAPTTIPRRVSVDLSALES